MANISAQMVKELRESTGAGMMDCKAALTETNGDMTGRAVDWLRKKGLSKAAKKAGRVAAEGLIGVLVAGQQGRRGGGQFGNRLRRPQRPVPGPGQDDRRRRAHAGTDVEKIKAAKAGSHHHRRRDHRHHRQGRREHDAAPRRLAVASSRAPSAPTCTIRSATASARSASSSALESTGKADELAAHRPPGRHARRLGQSAGDRSGRPRSGGGGAREECARRQVQASRASRLT